jgi:hypothetical protein
MTCEDARRAADVRCRSEAVRPLRRRAAPRRVMITPVCAVGPRARRPCRPCRLRRTSNGPCGGAPTPAARPSVRGPARGKAAARRAMGSLRVARHLRHRARRSNERPCGGWRDRRPARRAANPSPSGSARCRGRARTILPRRACGGTWWRAGSFPPRVCATGRAAARDCVRVDATGLGARRAQGRAVACGGPCEFVSVLVGGWSVATFANPRGCAIMYIMLSSVLGGGGVSVSGGS